MILHFLSDLNTICQIYKKYFKNNKNNNANEGYVYVINASQSIINCHVIEYLNKFNTIVC